MTIKDMAVSSVKHIVLYAIFNEAYNYAKSKIINGQVFNLSNLETAEKYLTEVAEISAQFFPKGKAHKTIEKFLAIEKSGGIKNIAQDKITKCADNSGVNIAEAKKMANCLESTFTGKSDDVSKILTFTHCYPMTPMRAFEVMTHATDFAQCLGKDFSGPTTDL